LLLADPSLRDGIFNRSVILLAEHGASRFAAAWLRHRGLDWAAELLPAADAPLPADQEMLL